MSDGELRMADMVLFKSTVPHIRHPTWFQKASLDQFTRTTNGWRSSFLSSDASFWAAPISDSPPTRTRYTVFSPESLSTLTPGYFLSSCCFRSCAAFGFSNAPTCTV